MKLKGIIYKWFIVFLLLTTEMAYSQCPVVINEIMVSPAGGPSVNCLYNADTLNGADPNVGGEWIELYNPDPCHAADISCYFIAFTTSSGNWGSLLLAGAVIPPNGHYLIGGSGVLSANINATPFNSLYCSSDCWFLNDSAGWVGLYNSASVPIDAVYWNIGGTAADLYSWPEYASDIETNMTHCSCCTSTHFENPGLFPVVEFAGNVFPGSSISLARQTDGSPVWGYGAVGGTPDTCNGGSNSCFSVQLDFSNISPTCPGGSNGSVAVDVINTSYPQSPYSYVWSTGDTTQITSNVMAGHYFVTVTDKWGCMYIGDTLLSDAVPSVVSIISNSPVCPGDNLTLASDIGGLDYSWTGPDGFTSSLPSPMVGNFSQNNVGEYILVMTDSNSCTLMDTANVQIQSLPNVDLGTDTTACFHHLLTFSVDNGSIYTYLWSTGSEDPVITFSSDNITSGTNPFWLWSAVTGCKTWTDSVLVTFDYCEVNESNVMTPNGDQINDYFIIEGVENFPGTELYVFNRWGKMVYQSSDYTNNWNGDYCPDGVYYYIIRMPDGSAGTRESKGWVTIIGKEN